MLKKKKEVSNAKCPCGGGDQKLRYEECCGPYHAGQIPEDATTLMRTRFSAYANSEIDYIIDTTHPENSAMEGSKLASGKVVSSFKQDVKATCSRVKFLKLEIESSDVGDSDDEAFVTFRTVIQVTKPGSRKSGGGDFDRETMRERSRFLRGDDGRWLYVSGDVSYE